jgi:nocardicin N-oxygenase
MYPDAPRVEVNLAHASGAEHTRLRKAMAKSFSARRVHGLRDRTTGVVAGLIDGMTKAGATSADFVAQFALPLPMHTICEVLGVPVADAGQIMIWSDAFLGMKFSELSAQQVGEYVVAFTTYLDGLVAAQRPDPGECVLGELARACNDGVITQHEAAMLAMGLMVTGREVSSIALANFVYLLDRLGQWRVLREDPELVPVGVDELLRFAPLSVGGVLARKATEDAEVGGHLVRRGETVILSYDAANRDESVFTLPGELNLARESHQHVAFGFGSHWCLGAELSRMMMQVALRELTNRLPDLRVTVADENLAWLSTMQFRGFAELPVAW